MSNNKLTTAAGAPVVDNMNIETLSDADAASLIGRDRESHHRDLFDNIDKGDFPRWRPVSWS